MQQPWPGQYATILGSLVAPTSRGNVSIRSADMADAPVINPNWLGSETDQRVAIAAYKRIRATFQSKAMTPVIIGPEYFPGAKVQTDEEILSIIKKTVMTIYHAACTCKMGVQNDTMAVVDNRARVFGVTGLRVVDASAFPILPPGHPQSTVCMSCFSPRGRMLFANSFRYAGRENRRRYYRPFSLNTLLIFASFHIRTRPGSW